MPRGDGTGPQGKGSKTGQEMGSCKGATGKTYGCGARRGKGAGRGRANGNGRSAWSR